MNSKITASKLEILATIITGDATKQSTNSTKNLYSQLQYRTLGDLKSLFRMFEITIDDGTRHNVTLDGLIKLNEKGEIYNFITEIVCDENLECLNQKVLSQGRQIIKNEKGFYISNAVNIDIGKNVETYEHLPDFIKQAQEDLANERYWDVITKARTILEITFKDVCKRHSLDFDDKNINTTFTNIRKYFGMDAKDSKYPDYIKGLITNTANLVNNIAEARNKNSSSHAPQYKPKKHHAQFCLEQAISLMNFIISVDESKK